MELGVEFGATNGLYGLGPGFGCGTGSGHGFGVDVGVDSDPGVYITSNKRKAGIPLPLPRKNSRRPQVRRKPPDKHIGLLKHESPLLIQILTGKIGLRAFYSNKRSPASHRNVAAGTRNGFPPDGGAQGDSGSPGQVVVSGSRTPADHKGLRGPSAAPTIRSDDSEMVPHAQKATRIPVSYRHWRGNRWEGDRSKGGPPVKLPTR